MDADPPACESGLNTRFNLYENGFVKDMRSNKLFVDAWQLLSPYRGGAGGTFSLNGMVRLKYKTNTFPPDTYGSAFGHSEKIIRTANFYQYDPTTKQRELRLSNGSIGVLCDNKRGRLAWFPEVGGCLQWDKMQEEDFDPAYAITVHKAQGSEFTDVFVVVPERRALLSRELLYTAMTRSTGPLTLFVQRTPRENPLEIARARSDLLRRNSSLFCDPIEARRVFEPEFGVHVKSKIEYVIYDALRAAREADRLVFNYEQQRDLPFGPRRVPVKPDFTVSVGARTYYWEHLGMLDRDDYFTDWKKRRAAYADEGLLDVLVTTDDSQGVRNDRLMKLIEDIISGDLEASPGSPFSAHHYLL
ncbi:MAG: ATP-binding domain-containing protein [Planctomycetes bacterium]|nr:ATP-binding domain-containing protein [Planctomycetota bacterium]